MLLCVCCLDHSKYSASKRDCFPFWFWTHARKGYIVFFIEMFIEKYSPSNAMPAVTLNDHHNCCSFSEAMMRTLSKLFQTKHQLFNKKTFGKTNQPQVHFHCVGVGLLGSWHFVLHVCASRIKRCGKRPRQAGCRVCGWVLLHGGLADDGWLRRCCSLHER